MCLDILGGVQGQRYNNLTASEIATARSLDLIVAQTSLFAQNGSGGSFRGLEFELVTQRLYGAAGSAQSVVVVDPVISGISRIPLPAHQYPRACDGIAFAPNTGKLFCATSFAEPILVIDPAIDIINLI